MTAHREQMPITGDNEIGASGERGGDDVIVIGIAGHDAQRGQRRHADCKLAIEAQGLLDR